MDYATFMIRKVTLSTLLAMVAPTQAVLLAHYDFTDGILTDNELGAAETLTLVTNGPSTITVTAEGAALFPGEGTAEADYLQVDRAGAGSPQFTVSMWFRTDTINQGGFQGLFSNNVVNAANNFSWQLDVNNGVLRLISAQTGFGELSNAGPGEPQIETGVWHQVVARKTAAGGGELWFGSEGTPLQLIGSTAVNPGGLQWFRLGVNRNSDNLYNMEMANVKIYNDANISLVDLNSEGPQLIPEPSTSLLGLLALPMLFRRKRH